MPQVGLSEIFSISRVCILHKVQATVGGYSCASWLPQSPPPPIPAMLYFPRLHRTFIGSPNIIISTMSSSPVTEPPGQFPPSCSPPPPLEIPNKSHISYSSPLLTYPDITPRYRSTDRRIKEPRSQLGMNTTHCPGLIWFLLGLHYSE